MRLKYWFFLLIMIGVCFIKGAYGTDYTYSANPTIGTYTDCPPDCGGGLSIGGTVKFKVKSVTSDNFTFTISKCDENEPFSTSGTFYVGGSEMGCNVLSSAIGSVPLQSGDYTKDITVDASWFANGENSYWYGLYKSPTGNIYYCGNITITRKSNDPDIPDAPSSVYTQLDGDDINVSWSSSTGATSYKVYMSTNGGSYGYIGKVYDTDDVFSTGSPGNQYCFKIEACNASGCSALSTDYDCETIPSTIICDAPSGLSVQPSNNSAYVSWDDSNSANDYEVKYKVLGGSYTTAFTDNNSIVLDDLNQDTDYQVEVRSRCDDNNYSPYVSEAFTTSQNTRIISLSGNLSFGDVNIGSSSTKELVIHNSGNSNLYVSSINYPTGFSGDWNNGTIASGSNVTCVVSFSPLTEEEFGGNIVVNSNKTSGNNSIDCNGTGVSVVPFCSNYTDCQSSSNCGDNPNIPEEEIDELYNAVQYLCSNNIIDADNYAGVNDPLIRQQLAKMAFLALFNGVAPEENALPSDNCQSPYLDLQDKSEYHYRYAKALLFLEYGDGISPFSRDFVWFNPTGGIQRLSVLKLLLETFNIAPATSGADFSDLPASAENYGYAKSASELEIISADPGEAVRPYEYCTRGELFLILARLMQKVSPPTWEEIIDGFNLTGFISPETISANKGMETGNFNHYTKSSFSIAGRNLSMNFAHSYNSYLSWLPSAFFAVEPLGHGWSHTYNAYITVLEDENNEDFCWMVHWSNGSIHAYQYDDSQYKCQSIGVYDKLTKVSATEFQIKKKNQMVFTFEKIDDFDKAYMLTSINDRNNNAINVVYETRNNAPRVKEVADDQGRKLFFTYTGNNLLQTVSDPISRVIIFAYNNEKLNQFTDAKSLVTGYAYGTGYGEENLLTEITLPKGNVITNTYFDQKLKSSEISGLVNTRTEIDMEENYSSGGTDFLSSTVTTTSGNSEAIISHYQFNSNGMVTNLTDNESTDVSLEYTDNDFPNIPTTLENKKTDAMVQVNDIDEDGNLLSISRKHEGITHTTTMTYTDLNDIKTVKNALNHTTTYTYTNGNMTCVTDPMNNETNIAYNSYGQPISITNSMGVETTMTYDGNTGQLQTLRVPDLNLSATSSYDNASRLISKTNFNNQETEFVYDNNDNLTRSIKKSAHLGQDVVTDYDFDANDNLLQITNALNRATTFVYDSQTDWLLSESFEGATKSYEYFSDGSLKTFTNPNGDSFNYSYDDLGRILDNGYASFDYDNNTGNLTSVEKDGKSIGYSYDGFNRIEEITYDGESIGYEYDAVDNLIRIIYPDGKEVDYDYNANNQLISVRDWNNNETTYAYNSGGQLTTTTYPNGVITTYSYDSGGRQTSLVTKRSDNSVIASYTFELDDMGNHTEEELIEPFTTMPSINSETINYAYNNANRITAAGTTDFTFDDNGNTTQKGSVNMSYDKANNLRSVSGDFQASYTYDGLGHRRQATRNGETVKYIVSPMGMGNILMETDANGNVLYYYIHGLGLIGKVAANGTTTSYYVYDYRGSTIAITDDSQQANLTHKYQYDDFGNVLQAEETDLNRFRYVGKYGVMYESDDLVYMRARYYDPTIGRFLSEDPIWSTNLYPYADNNPIAFIDPKGEFKQSICSKECRSNVNTTLDVADVALSFVDKSLPAIYSLAQPISIVLTVLDEDLDPDQITDELLSSVAGSFGQGIAVAFVSAAGVASAPATAIVAVAGYASNDVYYMLTSDGDFVERMNENGSLIWQGSQKVGEGFEKILDKTLGPIFFPEKFKKK